MTSLRLPSLFLISDSQKVNDCQSDEQPPGPVATPVSGANQFMFPALENTPCDSSGLVVSVQAAVACKLASVGAGRLTVGGLVAFFVGSGPL